MVCFVSDHFFSFITCVFIISVSGVPNFVQVWHFWQVLHTCLCSSSSINCPQPANFFLAGNVHIIVDLTNKWQPAWMLYISTSYGVSATLEFSWCSWKILYYSNVIFACQAVFSTLYVGKSSVNRITTIWSLPGKCQLKLKNRSSDITNITCILILYACHVKNLKDFSKCILLISWKSPWNWFGWICRYPESVWEYANPGNNRITFLSCFWGIWHFPANLKKWSELWRKAALYGGALPELPLWPGPHLMHGSLCLPESVPETASWLVHPFCEAHGHTQQTMLHLWQ